MKKIFWINAVRAFAIIAVYLSHIQSSLFYGYSIGTVHAFLSPWYVNVFFFISGYLLFRKQLSEPLIYENRSQYVSQTGGGGIFFYNIICRIVLPTILFAVLVFVPNGFIRGRSLDLPYFIYKTLGGGTAWFTSALAVSELIFLLLLITRKRCFWFYTLSCFVLGGIAMALQRGTYQMEIWACHRGVIALIFIGFGGVYWKYEEVISKYMKWYVVLLLLGVLVPMILFWKNVDPNITLLHLQPLGIVTTVISCILLIHFCKCLPENKLISFIGQNTLGIYLISGAVPSVICPLAHKLVPGSYLYMMLLTWLVCLAVACFIVWFINRWLPWMFDFKLLLHRKK